MVFLYCFFRLNLKTMILSPRPAFTIVPFTVAACGQFAAVCESGLHRQFYFRADIAGQLFHADNVTGCNPVLLSACFNDRVHVHSSCLGAGTHGVRRNHGSKL